MILPTINFIPRRRLDRRSGCELEHPQIQLVVTTAAKKAPWHSWAVVACGGMSIGHKGMVYSSKAMGLTMVDLFENESLRQTMRAEFLGKKGTTVYKALLPDGPPPVPENR